MLFTCESRSHWLCRGCQSCVHLTQVGVSTTPPVKDVLGLLLPANWAPVLGKLTGCTRPLLGPLVLQAPLPLDFCFWAPPHGPINCDSHVWASQHDCMLLDRMGRSPCHCPVQILLGQADRLPRCGRPRWWQTAFCCPRLRMPLPSMRPSLFDVLRRFSSWFTIEIAVLIEGRGSVFKIWEHTSR